MKNRQEETTTLLTSNRLKQLVNALQQGDVIGLPTETVYALAADARNASAINKIFTLKNRSLQQPLSVLLAKDADLNAWVAEVPIVASQLADHFWPGPLTLIFHKKSSVLDELTGGQAKIGLRVPDHPIAQAVLKVWGGGLAAPSANRSAYLSPTSAEHVQQEFGNQLTVINGGACAIGIESTVVDVTTTIPTILRPGAISPKAIQQIIKCVAIKDSAAVKGKLSLQQIAKNQLEGVIYNYLKQGKSITVLARHAAQLSHGNLFWINMPTDAFNYANVLYKHLREIEQNPTDEILVEVLPRNAAWAGIRRIVEK